MKYTALLKLRERNTKLSREDAAAELGVSMSTMNNYENGHSSPRQPLAFFLAWADLYKCTLVELADAIAATKIR